jgi:hypothetical protein
VHLRGTAPARGGDLTPSFRSRARRALLIVLPITGLVLAACARDASRAEEVSVDVTIAPNPPVAGEPAVARLAVRDATGPLRGARLRVEAHMSHPGMTPLLVDAAERPDGHYEVPLRFTMAGDWTLHVTGTVAGGRPLDRWIAVAGVRAAE